MSFSQENKTKFTEICLADKDLDDDCIKELYRFEWLKVLEVPARENKIF